MIQLGRHVINLVLWYVITVQVKYYKPTQVLSNMNDQPGGEVA